MTEEIFEAMQELWCGLLLFAPGLSVAGAAEERTGSARSIATGRRSG